MKLVAAAIIAILATQANAQAVICLPRDVLVASLEAEHGEHLTGGGLQN